MNNLAPAEQHECPVCGKLTFAEVCCETAAPVWTIGRSDEVQQVPWTLARSMLTNTFFKTEREALEELLRRLSGRMSRDTAKFMDALARKAELEK